MGLWWFSSHTHGQNMANKGVSEARNTSEIQHANSSQGAWIQREQQGTWTASVPPLHAQQFAPTKSWMKGQRGKYLSKHLICICTALAVCAGLHPAPSVPRRMAGSGLWDSRGTFVLLWFWMLILGSQRHVGVSVHTGVKVTVLLRRINWAD